MENFKRALILKVDLDAHYDNILLFKYYQFFIKSYKQEEKFRCRFYYKLWFFHVNKKKIVVFGLHLEVESVQAPEQMVFQILVHWRWLCLLLSCTCITANWCNDYVIVESSFEFRVSSLIKIIPHSRRRLMPNDKNGKHSMDDNEIQRALVCFFPFNLFSRTPSKQVCHDYNSWFG